MFPSSLEDLDAVGSAARAILAGDSPFTKVVLEIFYIEGREPSDAALLSLASTIESLTGKKVERGNSHQLPAKGSQYSVPEIQDISLGRSSASIAPVVSIAIIYLDSGLQGASLALGATVGATVMVLFPDKIKKVSPDPRAIESSTLIHEMGHILGLINFRLHSPRNREDPAHLGHSANKLSVMYWAVDRTEVTFELGKTPPKTFDKDDLADLKDIARGLL